MEPDDFGAVLQELRGLRGEVQAIREDMRHYRGFVGGMAWTFSAMAALAGFVWGIIYDR